jgi:hypothetical protein
MGREMERIKAKIEFYKKYLKLMTPLRVPSLWERGWGEAA